MSTTHSVVSQNEIFYINSLMYTSYSSSLPTAATEAAVATVSPKDYQKKITTNRSKKVTKPSKKIILGKPITSKQPKMSLKELKALNRQIRPLSSSSTRTLNSRDNILLISRNLRENLTKAKSKMMDNLRQSNTPRDMEIYHHLNKESLSTSSVQSDMEFVDDDGDSVNSMSKSGFVPSSSQSSSSSCSASTVSSYDNDDEEEDIGLYDKEQDLMPLYTPDYYNPMTMNMELFFTTSSPQWQNKTNENVVTEDQINSWLQRGGFGGDHMSPMTMATDQELADLLDFDM